MGFLSSPPIPNNAGEYGLFIAIAFVIGTISQAYASKAAGPRESFDRTMGSAEDLSFLQYRDADSDNDDDDGNHQGNLEAGEDSDNEESCLWILHPIIGPLCGWRRPKRGEKMEDVILVNRIWTHLVDTHDIPFETDSYSVLYHVMLSRVDNIQSPSRAIRIQAIRNFHRGMWITSWYSLLLIGSAIIASQIFSVGDTIPALGVEYAQSAYFEYWTPVWHLALVALVGVVVFWLLFESAEEDYLEYLFADYVVSIGSEGTSIVFEDENDLTISGEVQARVENDVAPNWWNDIAKPNRNGKELDEDDN